MKKAPGRSMHGTVEHEVARSLLQLADFAPSETTALPKKMLVGVQSSASLKKSPSNVNQLCNETVACKTSMATSVKSAVSQLKNKSENTAQTARVFSTGNSHAIGGIFASPHTPNRIVASNSSVQNPSVNPHQASSKPHQVSPLASVSPQTMVGVSRQSRKSYLACGYCYMKIYNQSQIQEHLASFHPFLALKSIRECTFVVAVRAHSKKAHSRSEVEYKKRGRLAIGAESSDGKFYKCDFCKFTSEKHLLHKHLATKHKMRVTCSHCYKRFKFASKLKEHHDVAHKDLPMKYSQETINLTTTSGDSSIENTKNEDKNKNAVIPEKLSYYGKKPDPIDLNSVTINMKLNGGESADLPLVYITERFNLFPKVILEDVMKKKLN